MESYDWELLEKFVENTDTESQISFDTYGLDETAEQLKRLIRIGKVMAQKYQVVATNPPYAGTSNLSAKVNNFVKKYYPDSKADLFAVFIERCGEMLKKNGYQATIILPDIRNYTIGINRKLNINTDKYPDIEFQGEIAINPYKKCELLYLPEEVLHEIPIAKSWSDIDRVIQENQAIRDEVNEAVGKEWRKMCSADKKEYLKEHIFKNSERCGRMIENYRTQTIAPYEIESNAEYLVASTFKQIKREGIFDVLSHSAKRELSSLEATIEVLSIFRDWIENNRGWDEILSASTSKREKSLQRLLHLSGKYYCTQNNIDMAFEANEGPGPVDLKMSRGNDKTVVEIKLSSNADYIHGYEEQIEEYAKAEGTTQRVFVYVKVGNPVRDDKIESLHKFRLENGENPPKLFVIDSQKQTSASKR